MRVKSITLLLYAFMSLPLLAAVDSSTGIAQKAIPDPKLVRTLLMADLAAQPSQARS